MKAILNKPVVKVRLEVEEQPGYICIHCGTVNSGQVNFSETAYGHASLYDLDGEYGDSETDDYDNWELHNYSCTACGTTAERIVQLFKPMEEEDEEDEDDEDDITREDDPEDD
jgi:DNA-directed RNA polymerase subunit RPC12/RpoP